MPLTIKYLVSHPCTGYTLLSILKLQVLQKQMDLELELYGDAKEKTSGNAIGKVYIVSLSSQPVDHEESTEGGQKVSNNSYNLQQ